MAGAVCLTFYGGNQPFLVIERRDGKERMDVKVVKKKKKENTRSLQPSEVVFERMEVT